MHPETVTIPLTKGQVAVVDAADAPGLLRYKWQAVRGRTTYYARRGEWSADGRQHTIQMHRQIMDAPPGQEVDHKNGNGLDNQRSNLRVCTPAQNKKNQRKRSNNTSGYLGVHHQEGRWVAALKGDYLGLYDTPEEAARAYDTAARAKNGAFAGLNFPDDVTEVAPRRLQPGRVNTSGYRGVSWQKDPRKRAGGKWIARMVVSGQRIVVGRFTTPEEAAAALEKARPPLSRG